MIPGDEDYSRIAGQACTWAAIAIIAFLASIYVSPVIVAIKFPGMTIPPNDPVSIFICRSPSTLSGFNQCNFLPRQP